MNILMVHIGDPKPKVIHTLVADLILEEQHDGLWRCTKNRPDGVEVVQIRRPERQHSMLDTPEFKELSHVLNAFHCHACHDGGSRHADHCEFQP